mmetsp:Transcript_5091/g.5880  ORF Transcript_5091/g.5880 Transcript_5091/m.5880 type:complete len:269 (+) Transcript_5091:734-1540(+)
MYRKYDGLFCSDRYGEGYNDETQVCRIRYFVGNDSGTPISAELQDAHPKMQKLVALYRQHGIEMEGFPDLSVNHSWYSLISSQAVDTVNKKFTYRAFASIWTDKVASVWFLPYHMFFGYKAIAAIARKSGHSVVGELSNAAIAEDILSGAQNELIEANPSELTGWTKAWLNRASIYYIMQWMSELHGRGNIHGDENSITEFYEAALLLSQQRARMKRYVNEGIDSGKDMPNCIKMVKGTRAASRIFLESNLSTKSGFLTSKPKKKKGG